MNQTTINIIFSILFVILFALYVGKNQREDLTNLSNESLQNLASVYNNGVLTVGSIVATGDVTIGGTLNTKGNTSIGGTLTTTGNTMLNSDLTTKGVSTLGLWTIKNDSIGIPGRADINLATDKWLRLLEYGQPFNGTYAGSGGGGGFAGQNYWSVNNITAGGDITTKGQKVIYDGLALGIQSARTGFLSDQGGWKSRPKTATDWEVMYPRILGY
jgi:hypothetical protein